jgi:hypothetical protein
MSSFIKEENNIFAIVSVHCFHYKQIRTINFTQYLNQLNILLDIVLPNHQNYKCFLFKNRLIFFTLVLFKEIINF